MNKMGRTIRKAKTGRLKILDISATASNACTVIVLYSFLKPTTTMASSCLSSCSISIPKISLPSSSSSNYFVLNHSTLASPIASASPKTLASTPITSSSLLSFSSPPRSHGRRILSNLRASVPESAEHSGEEKENDIQDEVQSTASEVGLKSLPNVDELIKAYKQAVLSDDDEATSEIEATLHIIENQKNESVQRLLCIQAEMASGKERYIRLQADLDNFRKRSDKEKLTITSDAKGQVIESLLAMVDSFERARQQTKAETGKEEKIDKSYKGIYKQFVETMRSLNVSVIPTIGKPFNPLIHEAIAREESEEFKAGIVIQEIRRGFFLGNRLLRAATVKVSSGPPKHEVPSDPEKFVQATTAVDESS